MTAPKKPAARRQTLPKRRAKCAVVVYVIRGTGLSGTSVSCADILLRIEGREYEFSEIMSTQTAKAHARRIARALNIPVETR